MLNGGAQYNWKNIFNQTEINKMKNVFSLFFSPNVAPFFFNNITKDRTKPSQYLKKKNKKNW